MKLNRKWVNSKPKPAHSLLKITALKITFIALFGCPILVGSAYAQVERWVDAEGKVHYSERAPKDVGAESVKVSIDSQLSSDKTSAEIEKIVLYTTSWCGYCKRARGYLNAANIAYEEVDIERSRVGRMEFEQFGDGGIPLIVRGEHSMRGFSELRYKQFLNFTSK